MKKRVLTGLWIALAVYLTVAFSHIPVVINSITIILAMFAVYEIYSAAGIGREATKIIPAVLGAVLLGVLPIPCYNILLTLLFPIAVAVFAYLMIGKEYIRLDKTWNVFAIAMICVFLLKAVPQLRGEENGLYYLISAITLCFTTDVAAYLIGSKFGRHKLMPKISPNKTVEGFAAGIITSLLVMYQTGYGLELYDIGLVRWRYITAYAVSASVIAQFGDLAMSAIKRICGVKDYGNLFPGHGGVLDRFDSHLFCISFTLLYCTLVDGYII